MATYESYKDSGVKWLGQIPSHWEVKKLRAFFSEVCESNSALKVHNQLQFKYGTIVPKPNTGVDDAVLKTVSKYTVVNRGDIIINGLNLNYDFISFRVGKVNEQGVITSAYIAMRPNKGLSSKFYEYLLKAMDAKKVFHGFGTGIRATLSFKELKHKFLPLVPLNEQEAIVAYLDKVTGDIDRAIEAQQKMIDALNERKQIIITRAVTRGLNPDAPLRDSGIDWLGKIPEHWDRICLKYLGDVRNGLTYRPGDLVDNGRLVIRSSNIKDNRLSFNDNVYVKDFPNKLDIRLGDIIICSRNGSASLVGKSIYIDNDIDATFGAFMLRFRPNRPSKFWHYALQSCIAAYKALFSTSTINQLTVSTFKHMVIALPSESERLNIVEYLDLESKKLDTAISNCERMISLFQERKQIIINEVVTGKTKVI